MQSNQRRSRTAIVLIALVTVGLAAGWWWSRRGQDATPIAQWAAPAPAPIAGVDPPADLVGGDPAGDIVRARRPGAARRDLSTERSYDLPRGRALDVIAALQPRAEAGDNDAAFYLFLKIEGCRYQLYHSGDNNRPAPTSGDSVESQLIARTSADCHGLTPEHYRNNLRWLEQAADSGLIMAQLSYAGNAEAVVGNSSQMLANPEKVIAYRRKAMGYLHRAAANGSVGALHSLGDAYHYGVLAPRDPARAYAYAYAESLALPQYGQFRLGNYAKQLDPSQLAAATQQGRRIYDACCK